MIAAGSRVRDRGDGVLGTVLQAPAVDPDGRVWPCHLEIRWDDGTFEIVPASFVEEVEP